MASHWISIRRRVTIPINSSLSPNGTFYYCHLYILAFNIARERNSLNGGKAFHKIHDSTKYLSLIIFILWLLIIYSFTAPTGIARKQELVRISTTYGVSSIFTSFVAIETKGTANCFTNVQNK